MNTATTALHGLNILVTRPKELANNLAELIRQEGGNAILYPVIAIEDTLSSSELKHIFDRLSSFDIAIFISPTAVNKTFEHIKSLPTNMQIAAIGSSTENALFKHGISVAIKSEGHTSEDLLQHIKLQPEQIKNKSIVIFRGTGGREHLGSTLSSRGANITYAEIYKRVCPTNTDALTDQDLHDINIITVTSNEGLQNLFSLTKNMGLLTQKLLVVPGERCKALAEKLGFTEIIQSDNATDTACVKSLKNWAAKQKAAP